MTRTLVCLTVLLLFAQPALAVDWVQRVIDRDFGELRNTPVVPDLTVRLATQSITSALGSPNRELRNKGKLALLALATPSLDGLRVPSEVFQGMIDDAMKSRDRLVRETAATAAAVAVYRSKHIRRYTDPLPSQQIPLVRYTTQQLDALGVTPEQRPLFEPGVIQRMSGEQAQARLGRVVTAEQFAINDGIGVYDHMDNARDLNKDRYAFYSRLTDGGTEEFSDSLISAELWALPFMYVLDWLAEPAVEGGIPLMSEDVIPLKPLPVATLPHHRGQATADELAELTTSLTRFKARFEAALERDDLSRAAGSASRMVAWLQAMERKLGCHLALTRHITATLGFVAFQGNEHARLTGNTTVTKLYLDMILASFPGDSLGRDVAAQAFHAQGVGILINEFPGGFFREVYKTRNLPAPMF